MELKRELKPFCIDYNQLLDFTYFYWTLEDVLEDFVSDEYSIKLMPDIPGYGAHWGGLFPALIDKNGVHRALCHAGMVHHPDTEVGIYFEVESFKNTDIDYKKLWRDVEPSETGGYDLNKDEPDFLKFFFPKAKVAALMEAKDVEQQKAMLAEYLDACFLGVLKALDK